jgi:hypothetical protein
MQSLRTCMRLLPALVLSMTATVLVGCATQTNGVGTVARSAPVPAPDPTTSAPSSSSTSGDSPSSTSMSSGSPSRGPSTPATSRPAAGAQQEPRICSGRCKPVASADVGDGNTVSLELAPSSAGLTGTSVVVLRHEGELRYAKWTDGNYPGSLTCSPAPVPNCIVVDGVGAHGSLATGYLIADGELRSYDDASSDTPETDGKDLNGDGWVDVRSVLSTENPSYATGKRYWTTVRSDGVRLTVTGCTAPALRPTPAPAELLAGTCPG